jgi:hypothetical protein
LSDSWFSTTDYFSVHSTSGKKGSSAVDVSAEFAYHFHPNFSISVGAGYMMNALTGSTGEFVLPSSSDFDGSFSFSNEFDSYMFPLFLTGTFTYPVMLNTRVNLFGGVGYYMGKLKVFSANWTGDYTGTQPDWSHYPYQFEGNSNSVGFHFGGGIDFNLSERTIFFVEALYRKVEMDKFDTSVISGGPSVSPGLFEEAEERYGGSLYLYGLRTGADESIGDVVYTVSNVKYSGLFFRIGLKFLF